MSSWIDIQLLYAFYERNLYGGYYSRIKEVCRRTRLTPKLHRPATPVGICEGVTILKFRYKVYAGNQIPLEARGVLRDTKCVTGGFRHETGK